MILVTGASGLVGAHLTALLSEKEAHRSIIALYNRTRPTAIFPNVIYRQCDLLDINDVEGAMQGITEVYHCAAIVSFNPKDKDILIHNNQDATAHLVNESIRQRIHRFIHVSSIATIGREQKHDDKLLLRETNYWEDDKKISVYSKSKFRAEMEVWRGFAEGLKGAIVNPGIILGEGDWTKSSSKLMHSVAQGLKWHTQGITAFVDVKDVAKAMYHLMKSNIEEERFIISSGNYSYRTIFEKMAKSLQVAGPQKDAKPWMGNLLWRLYRIKEILTGKPALVTKETAHTAQSKYYFDCQKFLSAFPAFEYIPIDQTIERMATAYKDGSLTIYKSDRSY